ncbi:hypothetical protein JI721_03060 [Alicyclobacillus cycloheptanicus]|uniref:DsbA family dithiol-disulfide isomerase n=1 Tax=Alicyclobacillus cycloheptanicus TaxID=1457 RepID=A0ABT9XK06_9BACL|nr:hypothetical protein [Alicyclobacillus cycloheptanicus]MDQ0190643.1 putative DsbA family dithiol-disulfide isomerase [Alicyclobacillus cycloheptanicus]WDM01841.1 hypothetical protein JI721_03060 [Alicyclobacillus cycloheptanicus]
MTNRDAEAYMVLAAKDVGLSREVVRQLVECLAWRMDVMTESEAVRAADKWLQSAEGG